MDPVGAVLLVGAAAGAAWWWFGGGGAPGAEVRLQRICMGDAAQAQRLIDAELERAPGITRAEAATRAVSRYERDNR
ncbi:MAG: hypothetical protein AB7O28_09685 [Vicinamibacterales bacterium]|jgi:hypothetical protein